MNLKFKSVKGYYYLDAWVMANIIQQSTIQFCTNRLPQDIDPCHRMYDQMTMAARSAVANIAEGSSRRQTSKETEMRLTDVARASLSELLADFFSFSITHNIQPWARESPEARKLASISLERAQYGDDIELDAWRHVKNQFHRFEAALCNPRLDVTVNANMVLINRCISMLQKMMAKQLEDFTQEGGFAENLTAKRIDHLTTQAQDNPRCPICGKPMLLRSAKRGARAGKQFWSCSSYPDCKGTLNIN